MNIYSVYKGSSKKDEELIFIKQGYSLIAGFFNLLWALYHKMWSLFVAMLIISFLIDYMGSSHIIFYINLIIIFGFSFFASEIREYYAHKKGYNLTDIILARSEEEAEIKYFTRITN